MQLEIAKGINKDNLIIDSIHLAYKDAFHKVVGDFSIPSTVLHYTSLDAFKFILKDQRWRFTDARHTIDPKEISEALDIFIEFYSNFWALYLFAPIHIATFIIENNLTYVINLFIDFAVALIKALSHNEEEKHKNIQRFYTLLTAGDKNKVNSLKAKANTMPISQLPSYIFCTTDQNSENLDMWRMFGDETKGVAIELNSKFIADNLAHGPVYYTKVIYEKEQYVNILKEYTLTAFDFVSKLFIADKHNFKSKFDKLPYNKNGITAILDCYYKIILSYKNSQWKSENEWRLFCRYSKQIPVQQYKRKNGNIGNCIYLYPKGGMLANITGLYKGCNSQQKWDAELQNLIDEKIPNAEIKDSTMVYRI